MPFSVKRYGTRKKMEKMKRCVSKVSASGSKVNPYAVCRASIYPRHTHPTMFVGVEAFSWSKRYGGYQRNPSKDR